MSEGLQQFLLLGAVLLIVAAIASFVGVGLFALYLRLRGKS